jgi:hypothetical protein
MAEPGVKAIVVLTGGQPINSQESVEAIRTRLDEAPRGDFSFMVVTDTHGREHWVNVRQIVEIHEPPEHDSTTDG